jgi:hypothetical protein
VCVKNEDECFFARHVQYSTVYKYITILNFPFFFMRIYSTISGVFEGAEREESTPLSARGTSIRNSRHLPARYFVQKYLKVIPA